MPQNVTFSMLFNGRELKYQSQKDLRENISFKFQGTPFLTNTNHWKICMVQLCGLRWYCLLKHSSIVGEKEEWFKILVFQSLFLFSWFFYNLFVLINFILPQEKRTTFCFLLKWFYLKISRLDELCPNHSFLIWLLMTLDGSP